MMEFQYIVRRKPGTFIAKGTVEASRAAVAFKKVSENIKDRPKKGQWYHVSLMRI